jgi:type I restriction enzyme R subunit
MLRKAGKPLATNPGFRKALEDVRREVEQIIDEVSEDTVLEAGASEAARDKARELVKSFESYLSEHKDDIEALQFYFSVPYAKRPRRDDIKALAEAIQAPPRAWTPQRLWHAYETLNKSKEQGPRRAGEPDAGRHRVACPVCGSA